MIGLFTVTLLKKASPSDSIRKPVEPASIVMPSEDTFIVASIVPDSAPPISPASKLICEVVMVGSLSTFKVPAVISAAFNEPLIVAF